MIRTKVLQTARRFRSTVRSPATETSEKDSEFFNFRSLGELSIIFGFGTFGLYEIYEGMFDMPQTLPPRIEAFAEGAHKDEPIKIEETRQVIVEAPPPHIKIPQGASERDESH